MTFEEALFHFHREAAGWIKATECGNCDAIRAARARDVEAAREAGRREAWREAANIWHERADAVMNDPPQAYQAIGEEFERRAGAGGGK